jgi:hypothetical protein
VRSDLTTPASEARRTALGVPLFAGLPEVFRSVTG